MYHLQCLKDIVQRLSLIHVPSYYIAIFLNGLSTLSQSIKVVFLHHLLIRHIIKMRIYRKRLKTVQNRFTIKQTET